MIMFVNGASHLQRPYGACKKSASAVLAVVKCFVADMDAPGAFRMDNKIEFTTVMFVEHCNNKMDPLRRMWHDWEFLSCFQMFASRKPEVALIQLRQACGWLILWGSECLNRAATSENDGLISLHEASYGSHPPLPFLPFFHPEF